MSRISGTGHVRYVAVRSEGGAGTIALVPASSLHAKAAPPRATVATGPTQCLAGQFKNGCNHQGKCTCITPNYSGGGGSGPGSYSGGVSGTSAPGNSFGAPAVSSVPATFAGGGLTRGGRSSGGSAPHFTIGGGGGPHGGARPGGGSIAGEPIDPAPDVSPAVTMHVETAAGAGFNVDAGTLTETFIVHPGWF
jgi:hypothetical protein